MPEPATPATPASVHELATELGLSEAAYDRAVELADLRPGQRDWLRYLDRFLMAAGTLLITAGIAAFFAWNWQAMHHFAKFALIQAGIVAAVIAAWQLRIDSIAGRASLFAAAFLVGILLAVFGQVYQTGADPYGLFLAWAVLILPWAIVGRQAGLWLLVVVLLNLTLIMYWTQVLHPPDGWWSLPQLLGPLVWLGTTVMDARLAALVFALNAAVLVLWEFAAARGFTWLQGRTAPRLIALIALYAVLAPTLLLIIGASSEQSFTMPIFSPTLYAGALAVTLVYFQYKAPDLFMLTVALFGAILVIMALAIRYLLDEIGSLFPLALLLVAQVAGAAYWLRQVSRRWEAAS